MKPHGLSLRSRRSARRARQRPTYRPRLEMLEPRRLLAAITDVTFDLDTHVRLAWGGDNWPMTWSDDGHQYTSWGDGSGFRPKGEKGNRVSLGFARVEGDYDNYTGTNIWGGYQPENPAQFKGKTYGMISIDGMLYMLNMVERKYFKESELYYSEDKGATWTSAGWKFEGLNSAFSVPTILNFGQDNAGARDDYVYVYAPGKKKLLTANSNTGFNSADDVDLARVHKDNILQKSSYEYFSGLDNQGNPQWTSDVNDREPVLSDPGKVHWTIQVAHIPGLNRYVMFNNPGPGYRWPGASGKLDIYEAAEPWGPWNKIKSFTNDWGFGYTFTHYVAPKWISNDGRDFTLVFSGGPGKNDSWNTVRGHFSTGQTDSLSLAVDRSDFAEDAGAAAATGTVTRSAADLSQPLTVILTSNDTSELTVPAEIVIPANAASATFDLDAVDDTLLDGRQTVTVTASAAGFTDASRNVKVTDRESLTLSLDQNSVAENAGAGAATGTVSRSNTDISQSLVVTLASSDETEATVPTTVTIPGGQASAQFALTPQEDDLIDGAQPVTITATANGYRVDGQDSLDVTDTTAVAWGEVEYRERDGVVLADPTHWFRMTAFRAGLLTVDARFSHAAGNVDLELYDADLNLLDSSNSTSDNERVEAAVAAGATVYAKTTGVHPGVDFRLANLVAPSGSRVDVYGTSDDETMEFAAGVRHRVTVQGLDYQFDAGSAVTFDLHGMGGSNTIRLRGDGNSDEAIFGIGTVQLNGTGYTVMASGTEEVRVFGGGGFDTAMMYDTSGDEVFYATKTYSRIDGTGFRHFAVNFNEVRAFGNGGFDRAYLYDSNDDNVFYGKRDRSWIEGDGFMNFVKGFDRIDVYSVFGGFDRAYLYDSPQDDTFYGKPKRSWIEGDGHVNFVQNFDRVDAYSIRGGNDRAYLYDGAGDNDFYGKAHRAWLQGAGFLNYVQNFHRVEAYALRGGTNRAYLYDSPGADIFYGKSNRAWIEGAGFRNYAQDFDRVNAYSVRGGGDIAYLYDSSLNDTFYGKGHRSWVQGPGFFNYVQNFAAVNSYAIYGGNDSAYLFDTAGDDVVYAQQDRSWIESSNSRNYTQGFEQTWAFNVFDGHDRLYVSSMDTGDLLAATGYDVRASRTQNRFLGRKFDFVQGVAMTDKNPTARVKSIDYVLELIGDWV